MTPPVVAIPRGRPWRSGSRTRQAERRARVGVTGLQTAMPVRTRTVDRGARVTGFKGEDVVAEIFARMGDGGEDGRPGPEALRANMSSMLAVPGERLLS